MLSVVAAATAAAAAAAGAEAGAAAGHGAHHQMNAPPLPHKPASVPSFRRALQSIRASDLAQEATLYAHHIAAEDSFWLKQEERFNLCLTRAQVGANSSRDLHAYLRRSSKLLQSVSESLAGLGSFGVQGETGTMRVACMSVEIVRKSTGSYLGELNARVFGESLSRAAESLEAANQVYENMQSVGSESLRALKAQRKATQDAWLAYIAQGQERHKCEQMGKPRKCWERDFNCATADCLASPLADSATQQQQQAEADAAVAESDHAAPCCLSSRLPFVASVSYSSRFQ